MVSIHLVQSRVLRLQCQWQYAVINCQASIPRASNAPHQAPIAVSSLASSCVISQRSNACPSRQPEVALSSSHPIRSSHASGIRSVSFHYHLIRVFLHLSSDLRSSCQTSERLWFDSLTPKAIALTPYPARLDDSVPLRCHRESVAKHEGSCLQGVQQGQRVGWIPGRG